MANAVNNLPASEAAQVPGIDGVGTHLVGGNGATVDTTAALIPSLLTCPFDNQVVKMGWSTTPINAMTREMGYKPLKAMEYGYFSVDLRPVEDSLYSNFVPNVKGSGNDLASTSAPTRVDITVSDGEKFDITDIITFSGFSGALAGVDLAARVSAKNGNTLTVQFLNYPEKFSVKKYESGELKDAELAYGTQYTTDSEGHTSKAGIIPAETVIYILGHAAAEVEASTTPYAALPTKQTQYMQKFMVQSLISSVMIESEKETSWGKTDINELLMQQFVEDIEKTYIWGVKSYTYDSTSHLYTRTTSGIVEQMIEGGSPVITINKSTFNTAKLVSTMSDIFVGNSGSTRRYMFTGMGFATSLFGLTDITKYVNTNETVRKFEYDFTQIKLFNYTVLNAPHPLFDKCGWTNNALVIDRQYLERRVFRSMDETALELKKTGAYDGESSVWSEISSVILKYPKCHALLKLNPNA